MNKILNCLNPSPFNYMIFFLIHSNTVTDIEMNTLKNIC